MASKRKFRIVRVATFDAFGRPRSGMQRNGVLTSSGG